MKIKIYSPGMVLRRPVLIDKGDWIDLSVVDAIQLKKGEFKLLSTGLVIELPKGFEAIVAPRSSTYKRWQVIMTNSIGIIDNTYCGESDIWKIPVLAMADTVIPARERICQFRIQLSQKASFWDKLRWLFSNKIELEYFASYPKKENRGGFGSTN